MRNGDNWIDEELYNDKPDLSTDEKVLMVNVSAAEIFEKNHKEI
jgi:hypothetical protein